MKKFTLACLMAAFFLTPYILPQSAAAATTWKFFSAYGPTEGPCCTVWQQLFDRIAKETNGELVIKIYWSGQHPFEGNEMLKVVSDGAAQIAHFYGPYVYSNEPIYEFETIPMLLPQDPLESFRIVTKLWGGFKGDRSGPFERVLQDKWGATMVHLMPGAQQRIFTKGYAANTQGSLKNHKIRVTGASTALLVEALGGTPVTLTFGEVYTGLSQGLIDGLHTSTYFANSGGFMEVCDSINMWEINTTTDGLMVNKAALDKLPENVRATFLRVMSESALKPEMGELQDNAMVLERLILAGKHVYTVSAEDRKAVGEKVHAKLVPEWKQRTGADADEVLKIVEQKTN